MVIQKPHSISFKERQPCYVIVYFDVFQRWLTVIKIWCIWKQSSIYKEWPVIRVLTTLRKRLGEMMVSNRWMSHWKNAKVCDVLCILMWDFFTCHLMLYVIRYKVSRFYFHKRRLSWTSMNHRSTKRHARPAYYRCMYAPMPFACVEIHIQCSYLAASTKRYMYWHPFPHVGGWLPVFYKFCF